MGLSPSESPTVTSRWWLPKASITLCLRMLTGQMRSCRVAGEWVKLNGLFGHGTIGGGAVIARNDEIAGLQHAFEQRADRDAEHTEYEFRCATHSDVVSHTDHERSQIEGTGRPVRWQESFVGLDHLLVQASMNCSVDTVGINSREQLRCMRLAF